jgi:FkbM family methyltransferase
MNLRKLIKRVNQEMFPTAHQKMVKKWFSDGGDYKFLFDYDLNKDSIVLDLGGYEGQWASDIFSRYQCWVKVFEPVKAFSENIRRRFENNSKIEVFNFGLAGSTGKAEIGICADGSSLFLKSDQTEIIDLLDVKDWFDGFGNISVQLMKVNIEGGEYNLLERLVETGLISRIENIQIQFHDIEKESSDRMNKIKESLSITHTPMFQYKFVWEGWTLKKNGI